MAIEKQIRKYIRQVLAEEINNFIDKEEETATKLLKDDSKFQSLGDPIADIEMNQLADELGSDGANAPTVSVTAGAEKVGHGLEAGQRQATFSDKTKST